MVEYVNSETPVPASYYKRIERVICDYICKIAIPQRPRFNRDMVKTSISSYAEFNKRVISRNDVPSQIASMIIGVLSNKDENPI